jgi:hypothetical protein
MCGRIVSEITELAYEDCQKSFGVWPRATNRFHQAMIVGDATDR